ncbi:hypothetical protein NL676_032368 [Syzygium grande]|nr:hypothetical protein NL676_032368 [Syzygium grande]
MMAMAVASSVLRQDPHCPRSFPETFSDSRCVGSSHGWLVLLDEESEPYLLDPLRGGRVLCLPPVKTSSYVLQVHWSDDNDSYSFVAFYQTIRLGHRQSMTLLPLLTLRNYIISKAVLSANPKWRC